VLSPSTRPRKIGTDDPPTGQILLSYHRFRPPRHPVGEALAGGSGIGSEEPPVIADAGAKQSVYIRRV
jgi:hypothetical protein